MQAIVVARSSRSKPIVTTNEELEPIKGGVKLAIISYILPLPTKLVEVLVVDFSTPVETLENFIIPKPIPLVIPEIGIGAKVTHSSEVFRTLDTILKDTHVIERLESQLVPLVEPIYTTSEQRIDTTSEWHVDITSEQLVDDLDVGVKHVVLGD